MPSGLSNTCPLYLFSGAARRLSTLGMLSSVRNPSVLEALRVGKDDGNIPGMGMIFKRIFSVCCEEFSVVRDQRRHIVCCLCSRRARNQTGFTVLDSPVSLARKILAQSI